MTVSIDGGISVNNITSITPTSIALNVSTVFGTTGFHSVTITNPDGQTITVSNIINVNNYDCIQTVSNGADSGDGSLRQAMENTRPAVGGCKTIILSTTDKITLNTPLPGDMPPGVIITTDKECSAGKVEIDGAGITGDGLTLNGGTFFGIYVHGFTGRQIAAKKGDNNLKCISVTGGTT